MVVLPAAVPVTRPVGLTVAKVLSAEVQPTESVRSSVVRSEKTPVAVSCREVPLARDGSDGVTAIEVSTAAVTVTVVLPDTPSRVAVILALPIPVPVTRPGLSVLPTVAIVSDDEVQLAKMRS